MNSRDCQRLESAGIAPTPAIIRAIYNAAGICIYDLPVNQDLLTRTLSHAILST